MEISVTEKLKRKEMNLLKSRTVISRFYLDWEFTSIGSMQAQKKYWL